MFRLKFWPPGVRPAPPVQPCEPPPLLRADADGSGVVDADDVFAYLDRWFSGAGDADRVEPTAIDTDDLMCFLTDWFTECE